MPFFVSVVWMILFIVFWFMFEKLFLFMRFEKKEFFFIRVFPRNIRVKRKKISFFHVLCLFRLHLKKNLFNVLLVVHNFLTFRFKNRELAGGKISRLIDFLFRALIKIILKWSAITSGKVFSEVIQGEEQNLNHIGVRSWSLSYDLFKNFADRLNGFAKIYVFARGLVWLFSASKTFFINLILSGEIN